MCPIDGTVRRGEKLSYKDMAAAVAAMEDGNGTIQLQEFEQWWSTHVGSLKTGEAAQSHRLLNIRNAHRTWLAICVPLQVVTWTSGGRAR